VCVGCGLGVVWGRVMCVRFFIFVVGMNGVVIILLLEVYGKGVEC